MLLEPFGGPDETSPIVLILVVMEYALRGRQHNEVKPNKLQRLNPCCDGICS